MKTAIICAGDDDYPFEIANYCYNHSIEIVIVFLNESYAHTRKWPNVPRVSVKIGEVGKFLGFLHEHKITHVVLAGALNRSILKNLSVDSVGAKWAAKLAPAFLLGDDALLKSVSSLIEKEGYTVISGKEFLAHNSYDKAQVTVAVPSSDDMRDIRKGVDVLMALGEQDVGQSVIVEDGLVLGIEAIEGTDNLIKRCKDLKAKQNGGVLVKLPKSVQDKRFDLPAIGINTLKNIYDIGLNGIAIDREKCIFLNFEESMEFADKYGLFIFYINEVYE